MTTVLQNRKRQRSVSPAGSVFSTASSLRGIGPGGLKPEVLFSKGLFNRGEELANQLANSGPYKHCVIHELVSDKLLRRVRREITTHLHFTPKETDIYKLHQTGDLLNIGGLSLKNQNKLTALHALRDAMYSIEFRKLIEQICQCGPLSGRKQDMSINCYVKGSHLLTHDDVIGSRRVSYILYLPDPDDKDCNLRDDHGRNLGWEPMWGGALRLFEIDAKGAPKVDWKLSIPPAWNQLSFFVVQPGISFHDVEEVVFDKPRLAISGWFHLPQKGEEGYIEGLEEKQNLESSRAALADAERNAEHGLELPLTKLHSLKPLDTLELSSRDFDYLATIINVNYLDRMAMKNFNETFVEGSVLQLPDFLQSEFSEALRKYITETELKLIPVTAEAVTREFPEWTISRPPHKHRYLYVEGGQNRCEVDNLVAKVADVFASPAFRKWLIGITSVEPLTEGRVLGRRFRPGQDYTLATTSSASQDEGDGERMMLEATLDLTPTKGWQDGEFGGYELYMDDGSDNKNNTSQAGDENDPAVYLSGAYSKRKKEIEQLKAEDSLVNDENSGVAKLEQEEDSEENEDTDEEEADAELEAAGDSVLITNQATWNTFTLVYRDPSVLKFVKYISKLAPGSRWDVTGEWKPGETASES
ncbi:Oxoglutarate and iron-dependent oxygenase degradation C-term-domain-containing protein [Lipomyces oligophaga]|uniref:Oxoglutarate and iron-dependent oxygenase degradation C-term-domain-containing protein n=1 Tax=Lipomyces oligophaga TaxID=45792 RepID=UPI0034CF5F62